MALRRLSHRGEMVGEDLLRLHADVLVLERAAARAGVGQAEALGLLARLDAAVDAVVAEFGRGPVVITKVVHGWRVGGLIVYLMGPGRAQEHVNPRVIATCDGRDAAWQPPLEAGARGLGPLIRALRAPAVAAGLDEHGVEGKRGYVWHLSARVAAADRFLTDAEWAEVARELLDGAGVAGRGDAGGPRWVAVRHADEHIHIAVVLVRQDTCRQFWPFQDYPRLRETARRLERRLGLTAPRPRTGPPPRR